MMKPEPFLHEVEIVIDFLKKHNVGQLEMFYGWSWGDWETFNSTANEIMSEIEKQEQRSKKKFGGNDVYIVIPKLDTQILFCHEEDIHIEFNQINGFVSDIVNTWKSKGMMLCAREDKTEIEIETIGL